MRDLPDLFPTAGGKLIRKTRLIFRIYSGTRAIRSMQEPADYSDLYMP
jgi:hypothetical protein